MYVGTRDKTFHLGSPTKYYAVSVGVYSKRSPRRISSRGKGHLHMLFCRRSSNIGERKGGKKLPLLFEKPVVVPIPLHTSRTCKQKEME